MYFWVGIGAWDKIRWLADYGEKHSPVGLDLTLAQLNKRKLPADKKGFPEPIRVSGGKSKHDSMKKLIIGHFLILSEIPFDALHFPTDEKSAAQQARFGRLSTRERLQEMNKPMGRMLPQYLPKRLPTKQRLQFEVLAMWVKKE